MRRLLAITLAAVAAVCGVAFAMAVRAAGNPARFTLSVTPTTQSVARGGTVSFSVSVRRYWNLVGATALRVVGLPPGVHWDWQLADGRVTGVVPPAQTGTILMLRTSGRTPLGGHRVTVVAVAGGARLTRALTLIVMRPRSLRFALRVSPARQTVARGSSATYDVGVSRDRGFRERVTLRALELPSGATAGWAPKALTIATGDNERLGSERIVVEGTSRVAGTTVRRYAVVALTVVETLPFSIGGDVTSPLYPGANAPLDLVLTNPHAFDIKVSGLSVHARDRTTNADCSGDANYAVTQYSGSYPLVLHPGRSQLSALVADSTLWPQISMRNLPTNQDACKDAVLSLDYTGLAAR
jgi:hypothetical protein